MAGVLMKEGKRRVDTEPQRRPCNGDDGGQRLVLGSYKPRNPEDSSRLQKLEEAGNGHSRRNFKGNVYAKMLILDFWLPELRQNKFLLF